jgi:predicted DNA repair protein MutK
MAGASLFALIDDIATVLDDVTLMTKVAAKKTAGVLGDDLALNAQQVAGVHADHELPVVWAVAKGSVKNKVILVPAALAISAFAPWAVLPLLMLGGAYLCYEGVEKLAHNWMHGAAEEQAHHVQHLEALNNPAVDMVALEKDKVQGAIRTDFVLSAEIIVITLGTVATAPFGTQVAVLTGIAAIMTAGVYGVVAGIVKLDDGGLYLSRKRGDRLWASTQRRVGNAILVAAPHMMKGLSILGTAAMFMVGGGILTHGIPAVQNYIHGVAHGAGAISGIGGILEAVLPILLDASAGILVGALVLIGATVTGRLFGKVKKSL